MAAGGISFAGAFADESGFPSDGVKIVGATALLTLGASATDGSKIGPLVRALAWLMLISAVYSTVPALQRNVGKRTNPNDKRVLGSRSKGETGSDRGAFINSQKQPNRKA